MPETQTDRLRALEASAGGRLGVYIHDTNRRAGTGWRENERFAHCSSFKLSLAAMVLRLADQRQLDLTEVLHWEPRDMLTVSPVTEANIERGLSVEALAHATLVTSDNTAANVLLKRFGGPASLTAFWRTLGDTVSRLDRYEPELNVTPPGTELDTTTPIAMARTTTALVSGGALSSTSKAKLRAWMAEVRTGTQRIRAGFPPDWQSGDKTGTGIGKTKHTYVDIAYGQPAGRGSIIVTAYFEPATLVEPMDPVALRTLAEVGRIASAHKSRTVAP
jgi:beta-lactamase class A